MRAAHFLSFCLFSAFAFSSVVQAKSALVEGGTAPPSFGNTVQGEEMKIAAFPGKIVIATFWASWCAPCRAEISVLAGVRKAVPKAQLEIIAINFGEERTVFVKASKRLAETGLTITHDRNYRLSRPLGIKSIPYMLLIDHTGKIKHIHTGFGEKSLDLLVDEINLMLKDQNAARVASDAASVE